MKGAKQTTLRDEVAISGIGVHSGRPVTLTLHPAEAGTGIVSIASPRRLIDASPRRCAGRYRD